MVYKVLANVFNCKVLVGFRSLNQFVYKLRKKWNGTNSDATWDFMISYSAQFHA